MNPLKLKSFLLSLALLFWFAGATSAQHDKTTHAHKSHNGGTVKSAGDYHIELVDKKTQYTIYLLDVSEKPINLKGVTGLAILRDGDRTVHTQQLSATFNTHFNLPTNGIEHSSVIINFTVDKQNITAKFERSGAQAMNFYCPSKCNGSESNLAGVCPKCGNALADRRLLAKD